MNRIRFIVSNMTSSGYWLSDSIDSYNNEEHKKITTNTVSSNNENIKKQVQGDVSYFLSIFIILSILGFLIYKIKKLKKN